MCGLVASLFVITLYNLGLNRAAFNYLFQSGIVGFVLVGIDKGVAGYGSVESMAFANVTGYQCGGTGFGLRPGKRVTPGLRVMRHQTSSASISAKSSIRRW